MLFSKKSAGFRVKVLLFLDPSNSSVFRSVSDSDAPTRKRHFKKIVCSVILRSVQPVSEDASPDKQSGDVMTGGDFSVMHCSFSALRDTTLLTLLHTVRHVAIKKYRFDSLIYLRSVLLFNSHLVFMDVVIFMVKSMSNI